MVTEDTPYTKFMYSDESHSMDSSTMIRSVAIWWVHDLSLRNLSRYGRFYFLWFGATQVAL